MLLYQYEAEPTATRMTGYAGLLPYLDLLCVLGVLEAVDAQVKIGGAQGWMDRQHVLSVLLLNLAGGEGMDDVRLLEADRARHQPRGRGGGADPVALPALRQE